MSRPKLPKSKLKTYQRIAVYPSTYKRLKVRTKDEDKLLIDLVDELSLKK